MSGTTMKRYKLFIAHFYDTPMLTYTFAYRYRVKFILLKSFIVLRPSQPNEGVHRLNNYIRRLDIAVHPLTLAGPPSRIYIHPPSTSTPAPCLTASPSRICTTPRTHCIHFAAHTSCPHSPRCTRPPLLHPPPFCCY